MAGQQEPIRTGAVERLREFSPTDMLLRTLLLHVGKGFSLRAMALRAKLADWADVSDIDSEAPSKQRPVVGDTLCAVDGRE